MDQQPHRTSKTKKSNTHISCKPSNGRKRTLNASLASWAELKHDAILYAEQPIAAECGGEGPPSPYTVGYVEPNVNYWKSVIGMIKETRQLLSQNKLLTEECDRLTSTILENAQFLLNVSQKELNKIKLTEK